MKIGFIGVGNLGEKAVKKLSKSYDLFLSDPIEKDELKIVTNGYFSLEETINSSDAIFFTIKPNMIGEIFSKNIFNLQDKTFISFMAGLSLDKIHELIGVETKLIRGMPTVGIGTGDSAIAVTSNISISQEVKNMLSKLGSVIEMKEEFFDAFTAIVGAGPAYFALLAETLVEIAHKEGFEKPESWVNTLMLGTSKIYDEKKDIGFENIMAMVASKGGVTEKALEAMKENGFKTIVSDAIKMAIERSKELGK
tara:strand:- start:239 stop:994 length:756 start_codon:yes stop_codon:yes gene_type:complete